MFYFDSAEREHKETGEGGFPKEQVGRRRRGSRGFNKHLRAKFGWLSEVLTSGDTLFFRQGARRGLPGLIE